MTDKKPAVVRLTFYGVLLILMAIIISKKLGHILPAHIAHHVSDDSEGYVEALILAAWIDVVRPRLAGTRAEWPTALLAGVVSLAIGVWFYNSHILGTVKTLNETFLALALLIPYVQARRPLPRLTAPVIVVAVLVLTVLAEHTGLAQVTTNIAEGVVMLLLLPPAVDMFDRGILEPERPSPVASRAGFAVAMVALVFLGIALRHAGLGHTVHAVADYSSRAQEAYVGTLLVMLYFAALAAVGADRGRIAPRPVVGAS